MKRKIGRLQCQCVLTDEYATLKKLIETCSKEKKNKSLRTALAKVEAMIADHKKYADEREVAFLRLLKKTRLNPETKEPKVRTVPWAVGFERTQTLAQANKKKKKPPV